LPLQIRALITICFYKAEFDHTSSVHRRFIMAKKTELRVASNLKFEVSEDKNSPPQISGFAIHPGIFNEVVEIPVSELQNLEETLKTAQLRYDHGYSVFHVIGKVLDAQKTYDAKADKEGIFYKAEIDDQDEQGAKVFRKIDRGYVNATSIGFLHESICSKCGEDFYECEHWFDEAHVIAKNCEVFELSVVPRGADGDATATVAGLNKEFVSNFKKQFGGKGMEPTKDNQKQPVELGTIFEKVTTLQETNLQKDQAIAELKSKVAKIDELTTSFETFKTETQQTIEAKDNKIQELESKLGDATGSLSEINKSKAEALVDRQIAVDLLDEEDRDAEIEALAKSADFDRVEKLVSRAEAKVDKLAKEKKTPGEGKVPKIGNFKKEGKTTEVDYDNLTKEQEQQLIHTMFGYDHVFNGDMEEEGVIPGHTYVGIFSNVKR
jgi:phage head maturation protease